MVSYSSGNGRNHREKLEKTSKPCFTGGQTFQYPTAMYTFTLHSTSRGIFRDVNAMHSHNAPHYKMHHQRLDFQENAQRTLCLETGYERTHRECVANIEAPQRCPHPVQHSCRATKKVKTSQASNGCLCTCLHCTTAVSSSGVFLKVSLEKRNRLFDLCSSSLFSHSFCDPLLSCS